MKIILLMPKELQTQFAQFITDSLGLKEPERCINCKEFKTIYSKKEPFLIITNYSRLNNREDHDKVVDLVGIDKYNMVVVPYTIDLNNRELLDRFKKAVLWFDDLNRPLSSVALVELQIMDYLGTSRSLEIGQCCYLIKTIEPPARIISGYIYHYAVKGVQATGRLTVKRKCFYLEPDRKINISDHFPYGDILRKDVYVVGKVIGEFMQF